MAHTPNKVQNKPTKHTRKWVQNRNCTLSILSLLKAGIRPTQIWEKHEFTRRQVKYVLRKLKDSGVIRKVGYGTWEVLEDGSSGTSPERRYKIIHRVTQQHTPPKGTKPNSIRGHGIVATVKIAHQRFLNWHDRHIILEAREIPFKEIPQGQSIAVGDVKRVWLTSRSIVYYLPYSWYGMDPGVTAPEVAERILQDVITLVRRTEKMLGIDTLMINGSYKVKFSRQHYSLIRNGLAKLYNRDPRRKLQIRDDGGLWLLIDNSYNLEELETVHPETARPDNTIMQNWANSMKRTPLTSEETLNMFAESAKQIKESHGQLAMYAKNLESHVGAINNLSSQASENSKTTVSLREAVVRLSQTFGTVTIPSELKARLPERAIKRLGKREILPIKTKRPCGLCNEMAMLLPGENLCDTCRSMTSGYKKPKVKDGTLGDYYES